MKDETGNDPVGDFASSVKEYTNLQLEIMKLEAVSGFSGIMAKLGSSLLLALVAIILFLLVTASAALYLGKLMGDTALGFLTLSGIYLLMLIVLAMFREPLIRRPIRNKLISSLLNKPQS